MNVLKVAATSNPKLVAGAIAASIRSDDSKVEIQAIGAGAVNQVAKSIAITNGYLAPTGIFINTTIAFDEVNIDGDTRTSIKFIVEKK